MRQRVRPVSAAVISLVAAAGAACSRGQDGGGGGDGGGPGMPASIPLAESPAAFARLMCEKIYGCCSPAEQQRLPVENQAGCEQAFRDLLQPVAGQLQDAITSGRARYDGQALASCLDAYQAKDCAAATPMGTVISHRECAYVIPLVELGQSCSNHFECKAGFCQSGTCVAQRRDGDSCVQDDECPVRCARAAPQTCIAGAPVDLCRTL